MNVASRLPRTPNAARLSTIVGADPRFPATAMNPHRTDDSTIPATPTTSACQNEIPKSRTNAPYDNASTDTFAANHGQNKSRGLPLRSAPEMTLIPLTSTFSDCPAMPNPLRSAQPRPTSNVPAATAPNRN